MKKIEKYFEELGLKKIPKINYDLAAGQLEKIAIEKKEAVLSKDGVLTAYTGKYTGRSPNDKFIVKTAENEEKINWAKNKPTDKEHFDKLFEKVKHHIEDLDEVFVFDGSAGADEKNAVDVRIISEYAWHSFFANLLMRAKIKKDDTGRDGLTIFAVPGCLAEGEKDGVSSEAFILVNFEERIVLIGGTRYAGEIKKSVFTFLDYILPLKGVLPMHCSATEGKDGDVALYFGLSGTGKTTLSADPKRRLIGDDEHGWSQNGVFNFEGGCYAKCINLDPKKEPQIYGAIKPGAMVENVVLDRDKNFVFSDGSLTENTRVAYPLSYIPNIVESGIGGAPKNIFFLTADAFGVLPPISKLDPKQALYYFLCGYTSKLAGTERGIKEPQANFSLFFGEPFMPLKPKYYVELFSEYLDKHKSNVYLVNTGWAGGPYGVGKRMSLPHTRALISAALDGSLADGGYHKERFFGLSIPKKCHDVPDNVLNPQESWEDKLAYEKQAQHLAGLFAENFKKYEKDFPGLK
jgi:phosphoenolpyruvate carboxykinase (ATP)